MKNNGRVGKRMYIKIHRGTSQIGGNLIEMGTKKTRILFDAGTNLPSLDNKKEVDDIEIEGLTYGEPAFDRVFISHHHNDHCGLLERILPAIPIFSGKETHRILDVIADFIGFPRPNICSHFTNCRSIQLNDMLVTPIGVDHSAVDAYMFLIQAEGKNILYTGDYRAVKNIPVEILRLIGADAKLNVLISEGTNIRWESRGGDINFKSEHMVEQYAQALMEQYDGTIFVLCSSTNEERILGIQRAAKTVGCTVWEDLFQWAVRPQREENIFHFVANYIDPEKSPGTYAYFNRLFKGRQLMGAKSLGKIPDKKIIFVRTSMLPFMKKYLDCRPPEKNILIYSMWQGYLETYPVKNLLSFCRAYHIDVINLHCSGHAYGNTIRELICHLEPEVLIPIHCDAGHREQFQAFHRNCLMLSDGERWEV